MTGAQGTLGEWLEVELASVEQGLAVRVRAALPDGWRDIPFDRAPETFTKAAIAELKLLLERGCETRWAAPGLLTVDALVTYGCEALAHTVREIQPETLDMWKEITGTMPTSDHTA